MKYCAHAILLAKFHVHCQPHGDYRGRGEKVVLLGIDFRINACNVRPVLIPNLLSASNEYGYNDCPSQDDARSHPGKARQKYGK